MSTPTPILTPPKKPKRVADKAKSKAPTRKR